MATPPGSLSETMHENALSGIEARLLALPVVEAVLLRLERAGGYDAADEAVRGAAAAVAVELRQQQTADGSWNADLFATCDALQLLRDVGGGEVAREATAAGVAWLVSRIGRPGRFGEGCDEARHARGFCHHFLPPFCSPGHAGRDLSGARLPRGTTLISDAETRLCAAACAARELALAGTRDGELGLQLQALADIALRAGGSDSDAQIGSPAYAAILDALLGERLQSPGARAALRAVAGRQRGDGSWPHGGTFVLDVLSRAAATGLTEAIEPLRRAADALAWLHGSREAGRESPGRLLIAWRALRCVVGSRSRG
jgi:hypothetical protein